MKAKTFYITLFSIICLKIIAAFFIPNIQTWEDYVIAENIISSGNFYYFNDGVVNHSFQFPVYPVLLSIVLLLHHAPLSGIILNVLISALGCVVFQRNLLLLQKKEWLNLSPNILRLLSLVPLLHPAFLFYELKNVHPFTHDFLMLNIGIAALLYLTDKNSTKPLEGGMMAGLALLGRGTFIVFPLITFCVLLYQKAYKKASLAIAGMMLMLSPWLIHNYLSDDIVGLVSVNGKILWKGSLHNSEGGNYLLNGDTYYSALSAEELTIIGHSSVKEQNEFFLKKYKKTLREEPGHVVSLFFIKLKNFWFLPDQIGKNYAETIYPLWFAYRIFNFVFIVLILLCLIKSRSSWFLLVPCLMLSILQCWFYFESRHRLIIEPLLIVILTHLLVTSYKSLSAR